MAIVLGSQVGGDIIYAGSATSYSQISGVSADNTYHYSLYSYDGEDYSVVASKKVLLIHFVAILQVRGCECQVIPITVLKIFV